MTAYVPGITETDPKRSCWRSSSSRRAGRTRSGVVTLAAGAAATVVTDRNCAAGSTPLLTPATANAAAEIGNGTLFVSAVANGSFTITHANSATTGRTFLYAIVG